MNLKINRIALLISFLLGCQLAFCEVRLPYLISDGMVLQRNTKTNIWGWATAGENVVIQFRDNIYTTIAGNDGKWKIVLPSMKEGGPYTMKIDAGNHLVIHNILIGDVWICSGQSNMTIPMERVKEKYPDEIANANYPEIRHFVVTTRYNFNKPEENTPPAKWEPADPKTVLQFTAVGYFFAKKLYEKYHVPIGLINSSVGGPPVESWMSEDALKKFPHYLVTAQKFKDSLYVDSIRKTEFAINNAWDDQIRQNDSGLIGSKPWYDTAYIPEGWSTMKIPGYWNDQGLKGINGVVWFRKEINVPASMTGKAAKLFMGRIIDADYIYVNGSLVGNITYQYPPRRYEIASALLKPGKNVITIRVINHSGKGGFAIDKPYYLTTSGESIDLKGDWQYKLGAEIPPLKTVSINILYRPLGLFNSMIAPLLNYTIKGIIWYQGEGNTDRPYDYHELFAAMITDWRKKWSRPEQEGNFPFIYVQLHNYGETNKEPTESNWAELREQQLKTLSAPNTAMAVAIDLGEWNDLHPLNKKDVGERLAVAAQYLAYGNKNIVYSGPLYRSMKIEGNRIIISFKNTGGGLIAKGGDELKHFAIAGTDKKFVWAKAMIEGDKVIAWNSEIRKPVAVRYAWADNPEDANLYNKEGLPASPFRTDTFLRQQKVFTNTDIWKNKKCAVVLTYDDALNVHLSNAIPALDSLGLKGTFYISDYFGGLNSQLTRWRSAAASGHELGNHTVYHPCAGNLPGREFVKPEYDLNNYTIKRMTDEIRTMNTLLKAIDGKTKRTFAYPCGDTKIGDSSYLEQLRNDFTGARGVSAAMPGLEQVDLYNINCYVINGQSGDELIALIKQAMANHSLLVFLFHGVGGEHSLNVSLEAHSRLLHFLKQNEKDIWIAPMVEVAGYIKEYQLQQNK